MRGALCFLNIIGNESCEFWHLLLEKLRYPWTTTGYLLISDRNKHPIHQQLKDRAPKLLTL